MDRPTRLVLTGSAWFGFNSGVCERRPNVVCMPARHPHLFRDRRRVFGDRAGRNPEELLPVTTLANCRADRHQGPRTKCPDAQRLGGKIEQPVLRTLVVCHGMGGAPARRQDFTRNACRVVASITDQVDPTGNDRKSGLDLDGEGVDPRPLSRLGLPLHG